MSHSLIVQTSFLGDMVLTTPLIAELAQRGPVDIVATPANAALLSNNPYARNVIVYDKRKEHAGFSGLIKIARAVEPDNRDSTAYLAQGSVRSGALAALAGFKSRVGFNTSAGKWLYTNRVLYRDDLHHSERLLSLAGVTQASIDQKTPRLYPSAKERAAVDALNIPTPFIALAPGSVWPTKRWPYFAELASLLSKHHNIAIVGGEQDRPAADEILQKVPDAADALGRLNLLGSAELIGRSIALVTNDSAPQHLASAMGTPTVSVFGPTVPDFGFGPLAPGSQTAGHENLSCRPCHRHGPIKCPLGHWRCMRDLSADYVYRLVMESTK